MDDKNEMHKNNNRVISLLGLFGKEELEETQRKLADATDFSFSMIDYKGEEVTRSIVLNQYCEKQRQNGLCEGCRMECAYASAKAAFANSPYVYECQHGLAQAAIPVIVNNQYLGAVLCGRVYCKDAENIPDRKNEMVSNINQMDRSSYNIQEFSYAKIRAIANMVSDYFKEKCQKESYAIAMTDYNRKDVHIKDLRKKLSTMTRHSSINELKYHRTNLLPQTLMNMLITISNYAIIEGAEKTEQVTEGFSSILRFYLENEQEMINLSSEVNVIESYMNIIAQRYEGRIKIRFSKKQESDQQMVPKLCLLPLVERLLHYGILNNSNRGTFYFDTSFAVDRCTISMQFDSDIADEGQIGYINQSGRLIDDAFFGDQLDSIKKRLNAAYKDDYSLKLQENMIILNIPFKKDEVIG